VSTSTSPSTVSDLHLCPSQCLDEVRAPPLHDSAYCTSTSTSAVAKPATYRDGYYQLVGSDTNDNGSPQSAAPYESSIFNYTTVPGAVSLNYTNTAGNETALYAFVDDGGYLTVRTNGTADSNHTAVTSMQWITTLPPCRRSRLDPRAC
jgi:hypothetical protein